MIRTVKMALMACVGLWGLAGAFGNLLDYAAGVSQVAYVLSMEGAKGATGVSWRSVHSPAVAHAGYAFIYGAKLLTGLLCSICAWQLFNRRHASASEFQTAKRTGVAGLAASIVMLFLGFLTVAGLLFEYWRVPIFGMITHQYAAIYLMCLLGFLIVLVSPEPVEVRSVRETQTLERS